MQTFISEVKTWMTQNKLKLNDDEKEALLMKSDRTIFFSSDAQPIPLRVGTADIPFPTCARNLGFMISDKKDSSHAHFNSLPFCLRGYQTRQLCPPLPDCQSNQTLVWTIVILFYLAVHFTFSVDYKKFRTLQRNWFSKQTNVIVCSLF